MVFMGVGIRQKERKDFVSLGCGTYLNRVKSTIQYNAVVIIYDIGVIEIYDNTVPRSY